MQWWDQKKWEATQDSLELKHRVSRTNVLKGYTVIVKGAGAFDFLEALMDELLQKHPEADWTSIGAPQHIELLQKWQKAMTAWAKAQQVSAKPGHADWRGWPERESARSLSRPRSRSRSPAARGREASRSPSPPAPPRESGRQAVPADQPDLAAASAPAAAGPRQAVPAEGPPQEATTSCQAPPAGAPRPPPPQAGPPPGPATPTEAEEPDIIPVYLTPAFRRLAEAALQEVTPCLRAALEITIKSIRTSRFPVLPTREDVALCVTTYHRTHQLRRALRANLPWISGGPFRMYLVDFNEDDATQRYVESIAEAAIQSDRLRYYRSSLPQGWDASLAKNTAHQAALLAANLGPHDPELGIQGLVLVNCDNDNWLAPRFLQHLLTEGRPALQAKTCGSIQYWCEQLAGTYGRIALLATTFADLGGYDEDFLPMGAQDTDMMRRAAAFITPGEPEWRVKEAAIAGGAIENEPEESLDRNKNWGKANRQYKIKFTQIKLGDHEPPQRGDDAPTPPSGHLEAQCPEKPRGAASRSRGGGGADRAGREDAAGGAGREGEAEGGASGPEPRRCPRSGAREPRRCPRSRAGEPRQCPRSGRGASDAAVGSNLDPGRGKLREVRAFKGCGSNGGSGESSRRQDHLRGPAARESPRHD